jgi:beta-galactosidase
MKPFSFLHLARPLIRLGTQAALGLGILLAGAASARSAGQPGPREHELFDAGWRFAFGNPNDPAKDFNFGTSYFSYLAKAGYGDGPAAEKFDDAAWRRLDLPHDWAVEAPFSPKGSPSHGFKAIGRNFPDASVGWYRKSFQIPASDLGRRISIEFDGVFRDSQVWVNGFYLGRHASGYTGFRYDLTDYLNYGGKNVIAVRVNATMEEGWFYEGAGIYRHVWLTETSPLHVAPHGTFVTTEVNGDTAAITARTTVANDGTAPATFEIEQRVIGPDGKSVAEAQVRNITLAAGSSGEFPCTLTVAHPKLWSLETPFLHRLVTTIRSDHRVIDRYKTTFGIRTIRFDPNKGFFLNGRRVELKGTNNHQDCAGVGVAVPDALQDFRIARLKDMGSNAYRCAHNPPAPELLDACDRLGMLVLDENRQMGTNAEQLNELAAMIRRDRNHPSVILWSLGNEEWAIEGNIKGARIASTMQDFARRLDPSRLTTVANSGGWGGISSVIDVVGYNYINQTNPDKQHADYPMQPGVGTEETTTQGTRGIYFDDRANVHLSPQSKGDSGGNCEKGWNYYAARPFLAGLFFWTGFDYRGEPTPFGWPAISSQFGLLDSCGFPKDSYYYLKSWWSNEPVLHIFPHWNWPGREGQEITVGCYSNYEAVELLLNGRSLGKKDMPRNGHLEWKVIYEPGTLEARGYRSGKVVATTRVETTGAPAAIQLVPDRALLAADGADVAVVSVKVLDAQGRVVPTADNDVHFEIQGPGRIIGVGNGDPGSHEPDRNIEGIRLLTIHDWRGRIAPQGTTTPSGPDAQMPLPELAGWRAPMPKPGEVYDLSAAFSIDAVPANARLHLFLPALGAKATVWVNGHELARDLDTTASGPDIPLDPGTIVMGANRVQMIVTPRADDRNHLPTLDRLGTVQVLTPAAPYQRRVFNGYAQVIVQTTHAPGEIRLMASAKGLQPATLALSTAVKPALLAAAMHHQGARAGHPTFKRGVNIDNWLSQNDASMPYAAPWFTEQDVAWIAAHGFDHLRFPIDTRLWFKADGTLDEAKVAPFDKALGWVKKYGLGAILDVHFLNGADFNSGARSDTRVFTDPALMGQAANLWRILAARYAKQGDYLRFEVLNEPKADKNSQLNVFNLRMLAAIRETNPTRVVYFPSNKWDSISNVPDLELPANDPNVAITVHFYEPMIFTHQKARWVFAAGNKMPAVHFPGKVPDLSGIVPAGWPSPSSLSAAKDIDPMFDKLAEWARTKAPGREIYLGEFGVYHTADPQSTINWVRAVRQACERHSFGWCVWGYRSGFPLRHKDGSPAAMLEGLTRD